MDNRPNKIEHNLALESRTKLMRIFFHSPPKKHQLIAQVGWSKQYILNIMDIKSTYDCVTGIGVVVKYPACIMDNDRVRLFGKLPADVHSIAKPTR